MAELLTMNVELRVMCKNLENRDRMSKSDPVAVLFMFDKHSNTFVYHAQTEVIQDCLNPSFITPFKVKFQFEAIQKAKISIFDVDEQKGPCALNWKTELLGEAEFTIANIFSSRGSRLDTPLYRKGAQKGGLIVVGQEIKENTVFVKCAASGRKLDNKDGLFGKSDPYLVFSRLDAQGNAVDVHKTEVVRNNLNPVWADVSLPLGTLCGGKLTNPFRITCFDYDSDGDHDLIGTATMTPQQLVDNGMADLPLVNEAKKRKKKSYKASGTLELRRAVLHHEPTFIDYLAGGCEVSLMVAIDFTMSNGVPCNPNSLHYREAGWNQYQLAIQAVGSVLCPYDHDASFPCWGYGAKLPNGQVSHCFQLSPEGMEVHGVDGILTGYAMALNAVQLYGPTNFAPSIEMACEYASRHCSQLSQKYNILMIITDGEITDMQETISAINKASTLPLSIIIVGVGTADFSSMDALDDDEGKLFSRDIVQFVPFHRFQQAPTALAEETLREIPPQFLEYMKRNGIRPNPPRQ
eukprot:GCRY01004214.1.p1 GENE.GCRY01004214.1~~GCRY01004214.1.p1  ORF type:complete len:521 (+),score=150.90 GCRY01004214.1:163-1725(+)